MLTKYKQLLKAPRELPLVLSCEFIDSLASFALDYVLVLFLSESFGFSDNWAGWIYGLYGMSVMLLGLLFGPLIDNLGVKWTLTLGSLVSLCSRLCLVFVTNSTVLLVLLLAALPAGVSLTSNVLKLGIRRYTNPETRSIAFDCSYLIINCAALAGAVLLTFVRAFTHNTTFYRVYLLLASIGCCFQLILACFLREVVVDGRTDQVIDFTLKRANPITILKDVVSSKPMWKFVIVSFAICTGVGTIMRHFGSTFPKTFTRYNGINAPYELILSLNPLIIICTLPVVSYIRTAIRMPLYDAILVGSLISALSMFIMGMSLGVIAAVIALCIFTIGEIMWAPRFMEWSVMVGKEGREGTVIALTGFPKFIARLAAGGTSGALLEHFCPAVGSCSYGMIVWLIVGAISMSTPIGLWSLRDYLSEDTEFTTKKETEEILDTESTQASEDNEQVKASLLGYEARYLWPSSVFS